MDYHELVRALRATPHDAMLAKIEEAHERSQIDDIDKAVLTALSLRSEGRLKAAIDVCHALLQAKPDALNALYQLAELQFLARGLAESRDAALRCLVEARRQGNEPFTIESTMLIAVLDELSGAAPDVYSYDDVPDGYRLAMPDGKWWSYQSGRVGLSPPPWTSSRED